jgi:glucokinase
MYVLNDYASLTDLIDAYLAQESARPEQAVLAVASPITGDRVTLTNHPWTFSIETVRKSFGFKRLRVINDLAANALAIPHLADDDRFQIGPGSPLPVASQRDRAGYRPRRQHIAAGARRLGRSGRGGHMTMAPSRTGGGVLELMRRRYDHVSAERVLSGSVCQSLRRDLRAGGSEAAPFTAP